MRNPNGWGAVVNLGKKRRRPYAVRITAGWTDDGKQKFKYISYHEKKTDAILALAEFNKNPYDVDATKITFADVYNKWSEREYKTLSKSSVRTYKSAYKHCAAIHNKAFREIKKNHLQGVIDEIDAVSMLKVTKILFMKLYKFGLENDIVEKDYSKFVTLPKKPTTKKKVPFTQDEISILWDNVENIQYADFTLILLYTGMRIGELLDIKKENVHLDERYMIGGSKTEAGKNRVIPLHKRILPLVENRMNQSRNEWVFTNKWGTKLQYASFIKNYWPVLMEHMKAKHTPHDTRHTFISNMDRLGVNTIVTKRIVGHANADVTEDYTHKTIEELVDAVDKLD